ncbi:transcriptional initiation protein Tat [Roseomonas sp. KE2513]|uniref:thiosulfate dehydrogenase n=1 Tax=Roseomonas sp. KE2513 TaxID=2479202 RepID=UPI001E4AE844|nr:transcriptional initiation protein Tat [Roseomonas sp. KE2513]MBI0537003.1 transcriptional initiation protein Tat [Roseomonas sp. KE2513]
MDTIMNRRVILTGTVLAATATLLPVVASAQTPAGDWLPDGADKLRDISMRLARAPRRRDFRTVPMVLDDPNQWDQEALQAVLSYQGSPKQVWDHTEIGGPWLNLMRNSLNAQIWSFRHPDFLAVSATHGTANLALLDQAVWDKYQLTNLAGERFASNTLIVERQAPSPGARSHQDPEGPFSSRFNSIPALQRRGVVFTACHNALWETAEKLVAAGVNPDRADVPTVAADLTNHLVPGVILTPGAVGTLPELQSAGFEYAK